MLARSELILLPLPSTRNPAEQTVRPGYRGGERNILRLRERAPQRQPSSADRLVGARTGDDCLNRYEIVRALTGLHQLIQYRRCGSEPSGPGITDSSLPPHASIVRAEPTLLALQTSKTSSTPTARATTSACRKISGSCWREQCAARAAASSSGRKWRSCRWPLTATDPDRRTFAAQAVFARRTGSAWTSTPNDRSETRRAGSTPAPPEAIHNDGSGSYQPTTNSDEIVPNSIAPRRVGGRLIRTNSSKRAEEYRGRLGVGG